MITFRTHCSSGTYIRSLAESIAERLGTVGHVTQLTRMRVGQWGVEEAKSFAWIREASAEQVASTLLPVSPTIRTTQPQAPPTARGSPLAASAPAQEGDWTVVRGSPAQT